MNWLLSLSLAKYTVTTPQERGREQANTKLPLAVELNVLIRLFLLVVKHVEIQNLNMFYIFIRLTYFNSSVNDLGLIWPGLR